MARKCKVEKERRRERMVELYAKKRAALKAAIRDINLGDEERWEAQQKLQKLPRNANPIRLRNRCQVTGRSRGVYRRVGLSRTKFREYMMRGEIPGIVKASW